MLLPTLYQTGWDGLGANVHQPPLAKLVVVELHVSTLNRFEYVLGPGTSSQTMVTFSSEIVFKIHSGLVPRRRTPLLPDRRLPNQCILPPV
jgi:hypothetical protein